MLLIKQNNFSHFHSNPEQGADESFSWLGHEEKCFWSSKSCTDIHGTTEKPHQEQPRRPLGTPGTNIWVVKINQSKTRTHFAKTPAWQRLAWAQGEGMSLLRGAIGFVTPSSGGVFKPLKGMCLSIHQLFSGGKSLNFQKTGRKKNI